VRIRKATTGSVTRESTRRSHNITRGVCQVDASPHPSRCTNKINFLSNRLAPGDTLEAEPLYGTGIQAGTS